ncbi:MAG: hypothetical protein C5B52_10205 [Bacteroidetes bacterium]|nr:MAG: hypothetical protein C5B52_10205 [Bacteroidota bacterium]
MRFFLLFIVVFQFGLISTAIGQDDSLSKPPQEIIKKDSVPVLNPDSVKPVPKKKKAVVKTNLDSLLKKDSLKNILATDTSKPVTDTAGKVAQAGADSTKHIVEVKAPVIAPPKAPELPQPEIIIPSKDWLFYIVMAILLFLALLRTSFSKYFSDMFRIFWHTSFRQKQIRDQLQQAALPSLLFNVFFVLSSGLFAYLVLHQLQSFPSVNHWLLLGICMLIIMVIYLAKFFVLKVAGWIFGQKEAAETYIFIVFLVNKVMSVLLLPAILILAFADPSLQGIALTLSILLLILFIGYRFIRSYTTIRNELRISQLHFFLYICGFELVPVLLIYKLLMNLFERTS